MPGEWRGGSPWWREHGDDPWRRDRWEQGEPSGWWRRSVAGCAVRAIAGLTAVILVSLLLVSAVLSVLGVDGSWIGSATLVVLGFVGGLVVVVLVAVRGFRRFGAPVGDVMDATERLADGDLAVRVDETGPPPIRRLARSFNSMATRLSATEERRRAMFADVSHELRTPLTVIGGGLEAMLDGVHPADEAHLRPLLDETRVLARLIEDLRTLSLVDAGTLPLHREPVEPAEILTDVAAAFRSASTSAGVTVGTEVAADVPVVEVDRVRLREVLANLLSNAIRHTPPGGSVRLSAAAVADGVEFLVTDDGEGIAADALPHVFDRYHRSADRGGSGLGLAIARSLVEAHGGTITAESDPTTRPGTTIRVRLPVDR